MITMSSFELQSHADYAKKYPDHEVSFFESMIIPPWASRLFGASNYPNEDLLNLILTYKEHHVFEEILSRTSYTIKILLYYRLLVYEKLLISLQPEKSSQSIQFIHNILTEISTIEPYLFPDDLLSEKDIRILLDILQLTKKLDEDLQDPYIRFSKVKRKLAHFYHAVLAKLLEEDTSESIVMACFLNPYFRKPGGKNIKITKAAEETCNYEQQMNEWIMKYPQIASRAIYEAKTQSMDIKRQQAIFKAATTSNVVATTLLDEPKVFQQFSEIQQSEIKRINENKIFDDAMPPLDSERNTGKYLLNKSQRKEIHRQAMQIYHCLYRNSKRIFGQSSLKKQSHHLKDILTIIINNNKDILPIIADYWHKTYKEFKVHSHSSKFQKYSQDYVEIIINFFNDKDIGEEDDAKLKAFVTEFIGICKNEKNNLMTQKKLNQKFRKTLDIFISLEQQPTLIAPQ